MTALWLCFPFQSRLLTPFKLTTVPSLPTFGLAHILMYISLKWTHCSVVPKSPVCSGRSLSPAHPPSFLQSHSRTQPHDTSRPTNRLPQRGRIRDSFVPHSYLFLVPLGSPPSEQACRPSPDSGFPPPLAKSSPYLISLFRQNTSLIHLVSLCPIVRLFALAASTPAAFQSPLFPRLTFHADFLDVRLWASQASHLNHLPRGHAVATFLTHALLRTKPRYRELLARVCAAR